MNGFVRCNSLTLEHKEHKKNEKVTGRLFIRSSVCMSARNIIETRHGLSIKFGIADIHVLYNNIKTNLTEMVVKKGLDLIASGCCGDGSEQNSCITRCSST
jgi:hypothetical protein